MSRTGVLRHFAATVAFIVLLGILGSCAPYGMRPKSPAHGGRTWTETDSTHFRVITDLTPSEGQAIARQLEEGLDAIDQVAFEHTRAPVESTTAVVFSEESDFHAFMPELVEGIFYRKLPGDLEPSRFVVLHGELSTQSRISCLHELTHDLFERNFGPAPPWLNEGWAEYYSTIEIEPDRLRVGAALPHLTFTPESTPFVGRAEDGSAVLAMPIDSLAPPSELLRLDRSDFYASSSHDHAGPADSHRASSLYLGSWALVHMLHDGPEPYPTLFNRFLQNVREARVETAWQSAFASVSAADLDRDFRRYVAERQLAVFEYTRRKNAATANMATHALTDAEVRVLWARLSPWRGAAGAAAKQDLDEAVAEAPSAAEPRYFRGLYWLDQKRLDAAEVDLSAAAQLAPNDPRYLLGVLTLRVKQMGPTEQAHAGDPVMQAAEPLATVARSALQLQALATAYADVDEVERGLTFATRAVALAPIDTSALDVEGQILAQLGRLQEAVTAERAAVAFLPEGVDAPEITRRLQTFEARLRAAPR